MLTCREVTEMANDYVDQELPWLPRLQMRFHLAMCQHCRRFARQLTRTTQLLRHAGGQPPDPETEQRLLEAFKAVPEKQPSLSRPDPHG